MPELTHTACAKYWFEYPDPSIYRVITFMESVEEWTLDGDPALETSMTQLGKELDDIEKIDLNQLGQSAAFLQLLAFIKTGRGLRLLQALDTAQPGSASKVLMYAEENNLGGLDPAGFFLKRNLIFERLRLLSRTFSAKRCALILKALEGDDQ